LRLIPTFRISLSPPALYNNYGLLDLCWWPVFVFRLFSKLPQAYIVKTNPDWWLIMHHGDIKISILFARTDSVYKKIPGCDVWDIERDARHWPGGNQIVAHPPCRAWGRLCHFAKPRPDEKDLARFAVRMVREFGGVLEHPAGSTLWDDQGLVKPGLVDEYGGWTLDAPQRWWGHKAEKKSWFYIVGCSRKRLPIIPFTLSYPTHVIQTRKRKNHLPHVSKSDRERTPPMLAEWLVSVARSCSKSEAYAASR